MHSRKLLPGLFSYEIKSFVTILHFFSPFSFELTTPASNFGAVTLTTSISVKLKRAPRWMAQSVHQER